MSTGDRPVEYLTLEDLLNLVRALGVGPVRDVGLLDSSVHRPQAAFMGQKAYPSVQSKAAALMHSFSSNHALVDGNRRLALLATAVFLRLNGLDLALSDDEVFDLTMAVAFGQLTADEIAARLRVSSANQP